MNLSLEQVFYGRGSHGYGILGASPGARPFVPRVETLCGAVGTPGGDYGGEPFLLSVPEGDHIIMICGRRGAPDSMGRGTLFFHALVAEKKALAVAKADAFSLFEQGAFADKMPSGFIDPLSFEVKSGRDGFTSRPSGGRIVDASLPCFVRVPRPAPDAVRAFVGNRANDLAWATFAFQSLDGFDVQVLPPRRSAPRTANEYDASGNLLRAVAQAGTNLPNRTTPDEDPSGRDSSASRPSGERVIDASPPPGKSPMLKFSLAANAVLAVLCIALYMNRKPTKQVRVEVPVEKVVEKTVEVPPSSSVKNEIPNAAVKAYRDNLAASFPLGSRIDNFTNEYLVIPGIDQYERDSKDVETFLLKIENYIHFVNTNLLEKTTP